MATYTSRMGLIKPAGSESRAVGPIASDMDLLDKFMPCILVNDGVTPPTVDLYDGALVKERTSGIIWEARKNGGGTYDKVYVRYPYFLQVGKASQAMPDGTVTEVTLDTSTVNPGGIGKNSSVANINGSNRFVIPVKGIWIIHFHYSWESNATGYRSVHFNFNGTAQFGDLEEVSQAANNGTKTKQNLIINRTFAVGDTLSPSGFQNSGGSRTLTAFLQATLVEPIQ